jgi:hypothetical protein
MQRQVFAAEVHWMTLTQRPDKLVPQGAPTVRPRQLASLQAPQVLDVRNRGAGSKEGAASSGPAAEETACAAAWEAGAAKAREATTKRAARVNSRAILSFITSPFKRVRV